MGEKSKDYNTFQQDTNHLYKGLRKKDEKMNGGIFQSAVSQQNPRWRVIVKKS